MEDAVIFNIDEPVLSLPLNFWPFKTFPMFCDILMFCNISTFLTSSHFQHLCSSNISTVPEGFCTVLHFLTLRSTWIKISTILTSLQFQHLHIFNTSALPIFPLFQRCSALFHIQEYMDHTTSALLRALASQP